MAVSSQYTNTMTRNQIINLALVVAGIRGWEQTVDPSLYALANELLNMLLNHWDTQLHIWELSRGYLICQQNINVYSLGTTARFVSGYSSMATTVAQIVGDSQVTLQTVSGLSTTDVIGITLQDGSIQWTTISTINPTTLVVGLGNTLTQAVGVSALIISYPVANLIQNRPREVLNAQCRTVVAEDPDTLIAFSPDIRMVMISRDEYFNYATKYTTSLLENKYYYDPRRDSYGNLYVYPTPQTSNLVITFDWIQNIKDFINASDTPDLPQEWNLALTYELASLLCIPAGKDDKLQKLKLIADQLFIQVKEYDTDKASILIQPDRGNQK